MLKVLLAFLIAAVSTVSLAALPAQKSPVMTMNQVSGERPAMVVIDPGHGGKDPGATGPRGTHEKNVVLAISRDLATDLNQMPGVRAIMTRTGDYYVTLAGRLHFARAHHADVFVAIHADSYQEPAAFGATVFALSETGAKTAAGRWLARSENKAVLGGIELDDHKSRVLRSVLINLSMSATIRDSLVLGTYVANDLSQVTAMHLGTVDQAPFMVLKSPDIPSLLIETGFLSNAKQEKQLNDPAFQKNLAMMIAKGIYQYLKANPPHHSVLEKSA